MIFIWDIVDFAVRNATMNGMIICVRDGVYNMEITKERIFSHPMTPVVMILFWFVGVIMGLILMAMSMR